MARSCLEHRSVSRELKEELESWARNCPLKLDDISESELEALPGFVTGVSSELAEAEFPSSYVVEKIRICSSTSVEVLLSGR